MFEVRSNFVKLNYIRTTELNKIRTKKRKLQKKDVMKKMAQAEEKRASIDSQVLFQFQAPEVLGPQVLVKEAAMDKRMKDESQSISKKLRKLFNKPNLNARITEEVKCINDVKANLDTKILAYGNYRLNF